MAEVQWVVVRVGGGKCGLAVEEIKEIVKLKTVTPLPHAPGFVEGLMNLRGQIIPVVNLGAKLAAVRSGFPAGEGKDNARDERVVVMQEAGEFVGLHVDAVEQVLTLDTQTLERVDEGELKENGIIDAVIQLEDALVLKLNTNLLLKPLSEEGGER